MDTEIPILRTTVTLTAERGLHRFVDHDGGKPTAGEAALGPCYVKGASGDRVAVTVLGIVPVQVKAAVASGAALMVDADGYALTQTSGKVVVARALQAATAKDDVILALLIPNAKGA